MDLLFYATDTKNTGKPLWDLYLDLDDKYDGEFYLKIDDLVDRLRRPKSDPTIAVFLAATRQDLEDLLTFRDFFDRIRIILILPNRDEETITKGHALLPRFLTYVDGNFDWVKAVLRKMLSNNNNSNSLK
jgi:hypothetical protein